MSGPIASHTLPRNCLPSAFRSWLSKQKPKAESRQFLGDVSGAADPVREEQDHARYRRDEGRADQHNGQTESEESRPEPRDAERSRQEDEEDRGEPEPIPGPRAPFGDRPRAFP